MLLSLNYTAIWTIHFLNYWSFELLHVVLCVAVQTTNNNDTILWVFELFFAYLNYNVHFNF